MKKHCFNPAFLPAPASAPLATAIAGSASISATDVKTETGSASQAVYVNGNHSIRGFHRPRPGRHRADPRSRQAG